MLRASGRNIPKTQAAQLAPALHCAPSHHDLCFLPLSLMVLRSGVQRSRRGGPGREESRTKAALLEYQTLLQRLRAYAAVA